MITRIDIVAYLMDLPCVFTLTRSEWRKMSKKERSKYRKPGEKNPGEVIVNY